MKDSAQRQFYESETKGLFAQITQSGGAGSRSIMTLRIPLMVQEKEYCGNLLIQYDMVDPNSQTVVVLADRLKDESVAAVTAFMRTHRKQDERRQIKK